MTLEQLKQQAREAINGHKQAVGGLYIAGVPKYQEERHNQIRRHFDAERDKALASIEEQAKALYREYRAEHELAGEFSPDSVLDASEQNAARRASPSRQGGRGRDDRPRARRPAPGLARQRR